jgi:hypothetical protein
MKLFWSTLIAASLTIGLLYGDRNGDGFVRSFGDWIEALVTTGTSAPVETGPTLSNYSTSIAYSDVNGGPIVVTATADADETCNWSVDVVYTSQLREVISPQTTWVAWRKAANGLHRVTQSSASSISGVGPLVGPRAYHSDHISVTITAVSTSDGESTSLEIYNGYLDYPIPAAPADIPGDGYKVASTYSGGYLPTGRTDIAGDPVTIADYGSSHLLKVTPTWFWEDSELDPAWNHWVHEARTSPGAVLGPVIGFSNLLYRDFGVFQDHETQRRAYHYLWHLEDTIGNAIARDWQGNIPTRYGESASIVPNFLNDAVMDSMAAWHAREWNWSENRLYRMGIMWDVYEHTADQPVDGVQYDNIGAGKQTGIAAIYVMDFDRDGVAWKFDADESYAIAAARISFLDAYRDALVAIDTVWGNQFIIGANTVSGRADADMLQRLDFVFMEDVQVPNDIGTGYYSYDGVDCYTGVTYMPYHRMFDSTWLMQFCSGYWNETQWLADDNLPNPANLSSSVLTFPAQMRTAAGGPYVYWETGGRDYDPDGAGPIPSQVTSVHPRYSEAMSLLADGVYPAWLQDGRAGERRAWNHPASEGFADLSGIGTATGPTTQEECPADADYLYWHRTFTNGLAEVLILKEALFDDQADRTDAVADTTEVDQFEYRVTVGGSVLRISDGWFDPSPTLKTAVAASDFNPRDGITFPATRDLDISDVAWAVVSPSRDDSTTQVTTDPNEQVLFSDDTYNGAPELYFPDHGLLWFDESSLAGRDIVSASLKVKMSWNHSLYLEAGDTLWVRWLHESGDDWFATRGAPNLTHQANPSWTLQDLDDPASAWSPSLTSRRSRGGGTATHAVTEWFIAGPYSASNGHWLEMDLTAGLEAVIEGGARNGGIQMFLIDHDVSTREAIEFEHFDGALLNQSPYWEITYY